MSISLSATAQSDMLNELFRRSSSWPDHAWLALFDSADAEITAGTDYARTRINFDTDTWLEATAQQTQSLVDVAFSPGPPSPSDWGTVVSYAFMYGSTPGDLDFLSQIIPLGTPKTPGGGAALVFPAGTITATAQEA